MIVTFFVCFEATIYHACILVVRHLAMICHTGILSALISSCRYKSFLRVFISLILLIKRRVLVIWCALCDIDTVVLVIVWVSGLTL